MEYVPLVEKERIVQEYLALRQTTESVIEITKIFTKRALFCLECFALELARMSRYMRMLKTEIRKFVSTHHYSTLCKLQDAMMRLEIEIEIQMREETQASIQPQLVAKRFKPTVS